MPGVKNEYRKEWRKRNPDKVRAQNARDYLKHREKKLADGRKRLADGYFKTWYIKNREKILAKNKAYYDKNRRSPIGRCACCGIYAMLVRDHDHRSGKSRELICNNCNLALGHTRDSIVNLKCLISYLEKHNAGDA